MFVEMVCCDSVGSPGSFGVPVQTFNADDGCKHGRSNSLERCVQNKRNTFHNSSVALLQERFFLFIFSSSIFKAWRRSRSDVNISAPYTWLVRHSSCYAVIVASSSDFETAERDERLAAIKQHQILLSTRCRNPQIMSRIRDFILNEGKIGLNSYTPVAWNKHVHLQLPWSIWVKLRNNMFITEELHCIFNIFHLFALIPSLQEAFFLAEFSESTVTALTCCCSQACR